MKARKRKEKVSVGSVVLIKTTGKYREAEIRRIGNGVVFLIYESEKGYKRAIKRNINELYEWV